MSTLSGCCLAWRLNFSEVSSNDSLHQASAASSCAAFPISITLAQADVASNQQLPLIWAPSAYWILAPIRDSGAPRTSPDEEAAESSGEDEESDIPTTATASGAVDGAAATQPQRSRLGQEAMAAATQQARLCATTLNACCLHLGIQHSRPHCAYLA